MASKLPWACWEGYHVMKPFPFLRTEISFAIVGLWFRVKACVPKVVPAMPCPPSGWFQQFPPPWAPTRPLGFPWHAEARCSASSRAVGRATFLAMSPYKALKIQHETYQNVRQPLVALGDVTLPCVPLTPCDSVMLHARHPTKTTSRIPLRSQNSTQLPRRTTFQHLPTAKQRRR